MVRPFKRLPVPGHAESRRRWTCVHSSVTLCYYIHSILLISCAMPGPSHMVGLSTGWNGHAAARRIEHGGTAQSETFEAHLWCVRTLHYVVLDHLTLYYIKLPHLGIRQYITIPHFTCLFTVVHCDARLRFMFEHENEHKWFQKTSAILSTRPAPHCIACPPRRSPLLAHDDGPAPAQPASRSYRVGSVLNFGKRQKSKTWTMFIYSSISMIKWGGVSRTIVFET